MSDRRTVDDLTIEELEQVLIVKRRGARAERMRRLRQIGRLPAEAALPHEDLTAFAAPLDAVDGSVEPALEAIDSQRRVFEVEPVARRQGRISTRLSRRSSRRKSKREGPARSRWGRVRDRLLLVLEVGALVGLVAIVVMSLSNLKLLNDEQAEAKPLPTIEPTPLAGGVLPSGHQPPEEPGSVPVHLRDLVEGAAPPPVAIPTPGPEAPTRIVIPALEVDALVVEGDTWEQLKLGVGHHLNTANPGERGNMVLSAHNDIYGEIFRYLPDLELGNEVIVYAGEQPYRYVVTAKQIVEPTEVSVLATTTKPVATLISCYPYMIDTHRIVVAAELQ